MTSDADFLGLHAIGDGRFRFVVEPHLTRHDNMLYGGTAIAASIAASELVSQRPVQWMTTQFVATTPGGAAVDIHAEELVHGHRTSQLRVTGTDESGQVMFASLGATGTARDGDLRGTFEHAPVVSPPEDSIPRSGPFSIMLRAAGAEGLIDLIGDDMGFHQVVDFAEPAVEHHPDPGPGRVCTWVRRRDGMAATPATTAFMADMIPLSVAHGLSVVAGGVSLDNTIRVGPFVDTSDWLLVDLRASLAGSGYGHGVAFIWSRSGELLAVASQTATMLHLDLSNPPWESEA